MADAGLFVGWSTPVRGREEKGLGVFEEALALDAKLQEEGAIESFEVVLLSPHGGGLAGFVLVRGSKEQVAAALVALGLQGCEPPGSRLSASLPPG